MAYRIVLKPSVEKALASLPRRALKRIDARILSLAEDPYPAAAKLLRGEEGIRRIRVGDYRILYRVEKDRLVVLVVRVGHRREVYRRLP